MASIKFFCPRWGAENISWPQFLQQVKAAGYDGVEWYPQGEEARDPAIFSLFDKYGLERCYVFAVSKPYTGFSEYIADLREELTAIAGFQPDHRKPLFISCQSGREFFSPEQTDGCLDTCDEVSREYDIPVYQETHRNKWSYAAHAVNPVLLRRPQLQLTLDISHWFCVSESYLQDQQVAVQGAIGRTRHVHARVGHTEGPQVWDPALPEYQEALQEHLKVWDRWVSQMKADNHSFCSFTPEFGPPPYLVRGNRNSNLQEEQWRLNVWMKDLLQDRYKQK